MKQSIQLRLGQHLTMTPQLQQAIRLLQLSSLELQVEIQEALESNPMLESLEEGEEGASETGPLEAESSEGSKETDATQAVSEVADPAENAPASSSQRDSEMDLQQQSEIPDELPVDSAWEDIYDTPPLYSAGGGDFAPERDLDAQNTASESLRDHLIWQIQMTNLSETDMAIATAIVDSVGEDGYLNDTLENLHASLTPGLDVSLDEVAAVLTLVQHLDPAGVAARDLRECLLAQLAQFDHDTPWLTEAGVLVSEHLQGLANHDYGQIMRRMKVSQDDLQSIVSLVRALNPRPGAQISDTRTEYIVPDVSVRKLKGVWKVELNPDTAPRLRINPYYASLIRRSDTSTDNTFLKNNLQEARWFLKSLQSRNETLLKVATAIVRRQQGFLEQGEEAMKALVLHDIAEELGMHESTVSRVTTRKYMHTPRGIYELKYFFSSHVSTANGGECSSTAIRALIKKMVAVEDPSKPLSDSKIAALLGQQGINVARRTVAKYREAMRVPPSNERKRLI